MGTRNKFLPLGTMGTRLKFLPSGIDEKDLVQSDPEIDEDSDEETLMI